MFTVASGALASRRGCYGTLYAKHCSAKWWTVLFDDGSAPGMNEDDLEPAGNDYYAADATQPPTPVAKAPGSAPPESLPGSLDAAECPLCHSAASRPSPLARRIERVVTDPIGAALIAWAIAVGGALWHFR